MKLLRLASLGLLAVLIAAFAGVGRPESATPASATALARTVTVTGLGVVSAVPDRAEFSFGVTSQAKTASAALAANAAEMRKVIAALKEAGVAAADLQTQNVSLQPRYSNDGQEIVGYTASNTVSAKLKNLDRAGAIVDAAVDAGANTIFGPSLTRSDATALYQRALRAAVANARAKAAAIASASGARLGRVNSVVEGSAGPSPTPIATAKEAAAGTPIEPGTTQVEATVTVEFSLT